MIENIRYLINKTKLNQVSKIIVNFSLWNIILVALERKQTKKYRDIADKKYHKFFPQNYIIEKK